MMAVLSKSSLCLMFKSAYNQVERLLTASCSPRFALTVGWSLLKKLKGSRDALLFRQVRLVVTPYVHNISYNLKEAVARHSVPVVSSALMQLFTMVPCIGMQVQEL